MNTRRFPRTTADAFKDATYASSIERPRPTQWDRICWFAVALLLLWFAAVYIRHGVPF